MTTDYFASRRNFLKTSLVGGSAAVIATHLPSARATEAAPTTAATGKFTSRVALTAGDDRANLAFKSLEPFKKEIAAAIGNKRVIVKPNNVNTQIPLCATHADNLEGILEFLKSIGKREVMIAESPAGGSAFEGFANYGYNKFVGKYGVKLVSLDTEGYELDYCIDEKDMQPHARRVSKLILDPNNFIISAAKLKTHITAGITLSLKNIIIGAAIKDPGASPGGPGPSGHGRSDKPITHGGGTHGINYNLYALSAKLHPHLAVIDGYEGMEGEGPGHGTPVDQKVCVASMDWLAADRVGAELMGVDVSKIGYMTYCIQAGDRGEGDLNKIEILGPPIKDHAKTYKLPSTWNEIISWQKPITG